MQIRDDRLVRSSDKPRSFGKRRSPDRPSPQASASEGPGPTGGGRRPGAVGWALRMAALFGILAVVGVSQLARLSAPGEGPIRVALDGRPGPADPETTGAIPESGLAHAAGAIRLDPCRRAAADALRR